MAQDARHVHKDHEGPMHATLLSNVREWADALDPFGEGAPALRLKQLAKDAATPFPLLVVAHRPAAWDRHGDCITEGFFDSRTVFDAVELVNWLAELELKNGFKHSDWTNDVEFHRLAQRPRSIDGYQEDDLGMDEHEDLRRRVDALVSEANEKDEARRQIREQARRVELAKKKEAAERAELARLRDKYP